MIKKLKQYYSDKCRVNTETDKAWLSSFNLWLDNMPNHVLFKILDDINGGKDESR